MKDEQYSFRLPRAVVASLDREARQRGIPKAQVVREALVEFLARPAGSPSPANVAQLLTGQTRRLGTEAGRITIAEDFDAPLPDEWLREFEG